MLTSRLKKGDRSESHWEFRVQRLQRKTINAIRIVSLSTIGGGIYMSYIQGRENVYLIKLRDQTASSCALVLAVCEHTIEMSRALAGCCCHIYTSHFRIFMWMFHLSLRIGSEWQTDTSNVIVSAALSRVIKMMTFAVFTILCVLSRRTSSCQKVPL